MADVRSPLSPEETARYKEGLDIVDVLARQLARTVSGALDTDDLRSAGQEALVHATRSYDATLGVPFRRWANLRCKGAMIDAIRSRGGIPRRVYRDLRALEAANHASEGRLREAAPLPRTPEEADKALSDDLAASAMAMALSYLRMGGSDDTLLAKDEAPNQADELARKEVAARLHSLVNELPEAERTILQKHYFEERTLDEAGKSLGLSKSWASRLFARAVSNLSVAAKRAGLGPE